MSRVYIDKSVTPQRYFDRNGDEIHQGDYVKRITDGQVKKVYLTEDGLLGLDATNPTWIENGRAGECEYGIYPFSLADLEELEVM